jgi:hypothetical protein
MSSRPSPCPARNHLAVLACVDAPSRMPERFGPAARKFDDGSPPGQARGATAMARRAK